MYVYILYIVCIPPKGRLPVESEMWPSAVQSRLPPAGEEHTGINQQQKRITVLHDYSLKRWFYLLKEQSLFFSTVNTDERK